MQTVAATENQARHQDRHDEANRMHPRTHLRRENTFEKYHFRHWGKQVNPHPNAHKSVPSFLRYNWMTTIHSSNQEPHLSFRDATKCSLLSCYIVYILFVFYLVRLQLNCSVIASCGISQQTNAFVFKDLFLERWLCLPYRTHSFHSVWLMHSSIQFLCMSRENINTGNKH